MFNKLNQPLRSFDLVVSVFLVVVVLGISTVIITREMRDIDHAIGLEEAESLAFQLINGGFAGPRQELREPASINNSSSEPGHSLGLFRSTGEIGKDPWGNAFRYRVLRDKLGVFTHVVVWSDGPNGESETSGGAFANEFQVADLNFTGDDFGYVHPIR